MTTSLSTGPAQERLYQHVVVSKLQQLQHIVHTFIIRPDFAAKVKILEIYLSEICQSDDVIQVEGRNETFVKMGQAILLSCSSEADIWAGRLRAGKPAAWAGLLIALTSELDSLGIVTEPEFTCSDLSVSMFTGVELTVVPGLASIKSLHMSVKYIDNEWCSLPHLCDLKINGDRFTSVQKPTRGVVRFSPNIRGITARSSTQILSPPHSRLTELSSLSRAVAKFRWFRTVCIRLTNGMPELLMPGTQGSSGIISSTGLGTITGSFAALLEKLNPLCGTLEHLSITVDDKEAQFLYNVGPINTTKHFQRLKTLNLPQQAFVYRDWRYLPPHGASLTGRLPSTLKHVTITCPSSQVLKLLDEFADSRAYFNNLNGINLRDFKMPGFNSDDIRAAERRGWRALENTGGGVEIR